MASRGHIRTTGLIVAHDKYIRYMYQGRLMDSIA